MINCGLTNEKYLALSICMAYLLFPKRRISAKAKRQLSSRVLVIFNSSIDTSKLIIFGET